MSKHRTPPARLSKQPRSDNFDPGLAIVRIYRQLVEVEALAIAADETAMMLPTTPSAKHKRTLARLYTLVSQTASRAGWVLENSEDMIAQLSALETARSAKRPRERRAR